MYNDIYHIIPFDIGCSFYDYDGIGLNSCTEFVTQLDNKFSNLHYNRINNVMSDCMAAYHISSNIKCFLMKIGIGVFVINSISISELDCDNHFAENSSNFCMTLYYKRKIQQALLLGYEVYDSSIDLSNLFQVMTIIWENVKKKSRVYTSNSNYKFCGFSYIYTLYYVQEKAETISSENFQRNCNFLLTPIHFKNILNKDTWDETLSLLTSSPISRIVPSVKHGNSSISASWSGALLVEEESTLLEEILQYQVKIQASWLLYDCILDNIRRTSNGVLLQEYSNLIQYAESNINEISANMHTTEKEIIGLFLDTSNISHAYEKATKILKNRVSIEEAVHKRSQRQFSIITDILLLSLTIISAYEPLNAIISSPLTKNNVIIICILIFFYVCAAFLIVRKGKL